MAKSLIIRILVDCGWHYFCSENKDADLLCGIFAFSFFIFFFKAEFFMLQPISFLTVKDFISFIACLSVSMQ